MNQIPIRIPIGIKNIYHILFTLYITFTNIQLSLQIEARCFLLPDGDSIISGDVRFEQQNEKSPVTINLKVYGAKAIHGFHMHEKGTIEGGCQAAGAHYNPNKEVHGGPETEPRHMGDLGNVITKDGNSIVYSITNDKVSLFGEQSLIGRTCVIHAFQDDLGKNKNDPESLKTGNSGPRLACGVLKDYNPLYSIIFGLSVLACGISASIYYFFFYRRNKDRAASELVENEVRAT